MGYSSKAKKGISWMGSLRIITRVITFLKTIILARLLSPAQFGIFGIASLALVFTEIISETGVNVFLMQEKENIDKYINTAWVISIIRGILISLLIFFAAPFTSHFFNSAESYFLLSLISIVPFIKGFINPSEIKFQKELEFNKDFYLRLSTFFFDSLVSVLVVIFIRSPAGLVWGLIAGASLEVILSFILIRPLPGLKIEAKKVVTILQAGKWVTAYGIFAYFAEQGDNITVGRFLGSFPLGIYQMAYKLSTLPLNEIADVVGKVIFPIYCKLSQDKKRLLAAFLKTTAVLSFAAIFLGFLIFLFPKQIILFLLGSKWIAAVRVLKVLAVYGVLRAVFAAFSPLFLSVGKQNYVTYMTFSRFLGLALTIVPLTLKYGIIGAGYSALVSILFEIPLILYFAWLVF